MKREMFERWILLQDAGELDAIRAWWLGRALRSDASLRAFQSDLNSITTAVHAGMPDAKVSDATLRAIVAKAESLIDQRQESSSPAAWAFRPAFALAAAALLLAVGYLAVRQPKPAQVAVRTTAPTPAVQASQDAFAWDDGLDTAVSELENHFASASDDWGSNGTATSSETDTLVEELMALEESRI